MAIKLNGIKNIEKVIRETQGKAFTKSELDKMGARVVSTMKDKISKGISPIQGKGRFPAYKNPARYPGKKKRQRPVNLNLSGDFLNSLYSEGKSGSSPKIDIGFDNTESYLKELGHRDGTNGQPKRPILPQGNETFLVTILNDLIDDAQSAVNKYFKKSKLIK